MPLPSNKIVTYKARETPSDENSNVLVEHLVFISAQSQNGDDITWQIDKLKFRESGSGRWTDDDPGLSDWVVTHADPDNPVASDFTSPPNMSGTAVPGSGDDLTYSLTLGSCSVSEGQMYGGDVACSAYSYVAGSETFAEEAEDEPVEIVEEDDA